jgi:hypothetical protein
VLAKQLLNLHESILATIVSDDKGESLAYTKKNPEGGAALEKAEIRRIGFVEFLGVKMAPRPGQHTWDIRVCSVYLGEVQDYDRPIEQTSVGGLRLARSSNMEYVFGLLRSYP